MKQTKEDRLLAEAYKRIYLKNNVVNEGKDGPGKGIIFIFAVGGEMMDNGVVDLPFLDAFHVRNHSGEHTFEFDDEGKLKDIIKHDIPEHKFPIMQSFTADDLDDEIFPGVYACLNKGIHLKNCDGSACEYGDEPIYAVLFTPGGSYYNDAIKAIRPGDNDARYLPLSKIYNKLGIE